jgi:hypothetical protein
MNINDRLIFKPSIGIFTGFLVINRQYVNNKLGTKGDNLLVKKILFSTSISLSIEYKLNEKFGIGIEPSYRYYFNNPIKMILKTPPYSYGLSLNIFYYPKHDN